MYKEYQPPAIRPNTPQEILISQALMVMLGQPRNDQVFIALTEFLYDLAFKVPDGDPRQFGPYYELLKAIHHPQEFT